MRYLKRDADAMAYQGHAYTWICIEEAGNFPSQRPIKLLRATLRSAHGVPCRLLLTGNPGGPGHGHLKRTYIDPYPDGMVPFEYETEEGDKIEAVFIPSFLADNPYLGPEYVQQLRAAAAGDEALLEAWLYGKWDVFVGQMYRLERGAHIVPNRPVQAYRQFHRFYASMDWGRAQAAYGLFAVDSDGLAEQVFELYEQLREKNVVQAARMIVDSHVRHGWPLPETLHADEQMWQKHGSEGVHLAAEFERALREAAGDACPTLVQALHRPGSRTVKVDLIHQWLDVGEERDARGQLQPWALPGLRFSERCKETIRVLQEIPRDPENPNDVDPDYVEDHLHDMVGFFAASRPAPAVKPRKAVPVDLHPGLRRDGTRKTREWSENDDLEDWLKANNVAPSGRYGRRLGR